jgi:hypothetical protein
VGVGRGGGSFRARPNSPAKQAGLERAGLAVAERVRLVVVPGPENVRSLVAGRRLGQLLDGLDKALVRR